MNILKDFLLRLLYLIPNLVRVGYENSRCILQFHKNNALKTDLGGQEAYIWGEGPKLFVWLHGGAWLLGGPRLTRSVDGFVNVALAYPLGFQRLETRLSAIRAALDALQEQYPDHEIWLGGESAGASLAWHLQDYASQLILLSPARSPVGVVCMGKHDLYPELKIPTLVVHGKYDALIPLGRIQKWLPKLPGLKPDVIILPNGMHSSENLFSAMRKWVIAHSN